MNPRLPLLLLVATLMPVIARGNDAMPPVENAHLELKLNEGSPTVKGLELELDKPAIRPGDPEKDDRPYVRIKGRFTRPNSTVIVGKERFEGSKKGTFVLEVPAESKLTYVTATTVDIHGVQENAEYVVAFPDWDLFNTNARVKEGRKNIVTLGSSLGLISYTEDQTPDITQIGLNFHVGYRRLLLPWLDVRARIDAVALPISATGGMQFRNIGMNLLAGVVTPLPREPWRLGVLVGYYRIDMFEGTGLFGFTSAAGPQLYPNIQYTLPSGDFVSAYFKYSPVADQIGFLSFSNNNELSAGATYARKARDETFWKYSLTYTLFQLSIQGIRISSSTITAGVSYDFWFPK